MNRFNRFTALRWMYNIIVPPRYRDKLNITEELCALESAVNKVIEVTNNNGKALEAISQDLEDIQFGAGGYYRPAITKNEDGSVTFSFDASDDSLPPIEEKTFFLGVKQTITEMLEGFNEEPMAVKNYIDEMSGGYYTPVFKQKGSAVEVSFLASNKMLPALDVFSFTLPSGPSGKSAYAIYKANGGLLSVDEWLSSLKGDDGKSVYEVAVDNGFKGSVEDFFASLKGDPYKLTETDKAVIVQAVIAELGGQPVFGYLNADNRIIFNIDIDEGEYDVYFKDKDGNLTKGGSLTVVEEPDPTTYAVTFVADGVTVAVVTYTEGDTSLSNIPAVPAKDGYTGEWESYTLNNTNITVNAIYTAIEPEPTTYTVTFVADGQTIKVVEYTEGDKTLTGVPSVPEKDGYTGAWESYTLNNTNITVNAIYTAIEPVEPINQIPISTDASGALFVGTNGEAGYKTGYRLKTSTGAEDVLSGYKVTGFIPVEQNKTIYIDKITISAASGNEAICFYDSTRKFISGGYASTFFGGTVSGTVASGVVGVANAKYVRLAAKVIDENSIMTVDMPLT